MALVSAGDVVVVDRLDRTNPGDRAIVLPCCGIFKMRDGKISVCRDYFGLATDTRAASGGAS
ncbi:MULTISPECIES: limonene-1,2-epoxide hydrolase family protein [unclassified Hyphomonas]|uniref:limonene-1,2-epoxide hydrolase family protein n=1 Tax=Hyphomonas sp. CY54-11-8 TaxID=1280944 RepID=UPI0009DDE189